MRAVQSRLKKYSGFRTTQIIFTTTAIPPPREGRFAIVTDVEAGCDGREVALLTRAPASADGEVVWS